MNILNEQCNLHSHFLILTLYLHLRQLLADTVTQLLAASYNGAESTHKHNVTASLSEIIVHLYRAFRPRDPLSCDRTVPLNEYVTWIPQERSNSMDWNLLKTLSGVECGI